MGNKKSFLIVGILAGYIILLAIFYKINREMVLPIALFFSFFSLIISLLLVNDKKATRK